MAHIFKVFRNLDQSVQLSITPDPVTHSTMPMEHHSVGGFPAGGTAAERDQWRLFVRGILRQRRDDFIARAAAFTNPPAPVELPSSDWLD